MKVLQLPDVLHEYLVHVLEKHAASGIHPEEGLALSKLWDASTKSVTHIPDAEIAKMATAGLRTGQSVPEAVSESGKSFEVRELMSGKTIKVECEACYNEEGSHACIRPSHDVWKSAHTVPVLPEGF